MSLSRYALRIATARALKGATLAGTRVFDSAVEPIDVQARERREPFIVVLTDEHVLNVQGRDLRHGEDNCDLVIEVAVATRATATDGTEQIVIPHTDAAMEFTLDLLSSQIVETLMAGNGTWARLWRQFAFTVKQITSRRGAGAEDGFRFAARQIVMQTNLLASPIRGDGIVAGGAWASLLAAMEADPDLNDMAALVRYALEGDAPLTDEALVASTYGLGAEAVDALGLVPARDDNGELVTVDQIVIDTGTGGNWTITEEAADEAGA